MTDVYDGFEEDVLGWLEMVDKASADVLGLILNNRIFIDRTKGISMTLRSLISMGMANLNWWPRETPIIELII